MTVDREQVRWEPLPSSLRTPEQMRWIHDRFKIDGLERLARADREYADDHGYYLPDVAALAHAALIELEQAERARDEQRRRVPSDEGGPGHEESYWLRLKLQGAIQHLRDVEDYYRVHAGMPDSMNMLRAERARALYEAITEDFVNGKATRPSRADLEARLATVPALVEALTLIREKSQNWEGDYAEQVLAAYEQAQEPEPRPLEPDASDGWEQTREQAQEQR